MEKKLVICCLLFVSLTVYGDSNSIQTMETTAELPSSIEYCNRDPAALFARAESDLYEQVHGVGFQYYLKNSPTSQAGMIIFPDSSECNEWEFYSGNCGQEFTIYHANEMSCHRSFT